MTRTNKFSRRQILVGSGSTAVALSLGDLMFPNGLLAATPRTGGKLVYTSNSGNSKHKSLKKAMHPYFGLEIRTKNTYDALTWVDENLGVVPELATSWEADESQTVWEVDIREGVRFHDGRDLTADDVVASYMMHKDKKLGTSFSKKVISGVEKIGSHKVRFTLKIANSEFPWLMAEYRQAIMPAGPLGEMGYSGIGTGPFKFAKIDPGRRAIYEANEDYWGDGPYLDRLECIGQKGLDPVNGYLSGQFDAVLGADPGSVSHLAAAPDTKIDIAAAGDQILMVLPKHEGSPFMDRRVREALSLALDRDAIVRIVYAGKFGWVSNDTHMANVGGDFLPKDGVRDVAKAKKLLAEAGYGGGLTLKVMVDRQVPPRIENVIAASLGSIGITIEVRRATESEFLEELYLPKFGAGTPPSFDILLLSMPVGTIFHSAMVPMTLLYSRQPNESALRDPTLDRMYEAAVRDPDSGPEAWREIEAYVHDNHLLFIGYQERAVFGVRKGLRFTPRTLMSFWDAYYDE